MFIYLCNPVSNVTEIVCTETKLQAKHNTNTSLYKSLAYVGHVAL